MVQRAFDGIERCRMDEGNMKREGMRGLGTEEEGEQGGG
jgi:hypothetical protein